MFDLSSRPPKVTNEVGMHTDTTAHWSHDHTFVGARHAENERTSIPTASAGSTNCGRNATKKSATFGLRRFVKNPRLKICRVEKAAGGFDNPPDARRADTPSQMR